MCYIQTNESLKRLGGTPTSGQGRIYIKGGVARHPTGQVSARMTMNGQSARIDKDLVLLIRVWKNVIRRN